MDINVFMAQIAEQYDDVDVAILTPETAFRKVEGWTSLVALMIITMIDEPRPWELIHQCDQPVQQYLPQQ